MSPPGLRYEVAARIVGPGVSEITSKASRIAFASSPGQGPDLPGPADLLASAFAACLLKNVERVAGILPFHHEGASVHVRAEREEHPPRFARTAYTLRVITDEDPVRIDLLHRNLRKLIAEPVAAPPESEGRLATR